MSFARPSRVNPDGATLNNPVVKVNIDVRC